MIYSHAEGTVNGSDSFHLFVTFIFLHGICAIAGIVLTKSFYLKQILDAHTQRTSGSSPE